MKEKIIYYGCDPELVLESRIGRSVYAGNYLDFVDDFGTDGDSHIAEIRPGISDNPVELVGKIRKVMLSKNDIKHLIWRAGHYVDGHPIGGHIHISYRENVNMLVNNLDAVVMALSDVFDDKNQVERRKRTGYGGNGLYHTKEYGLEYRSPGSWLINPALSLVYLTLSKLVTLMTIKGFTFSVEERRKGPKKLLLNFYRSFDSIPEDCKKGLEVLNNMIDKKINWLADIKGNWRIS